MTSRAFALAALLMAVATLSPPTPAIAETAAAADQNEGAANMEKLVDSYATVSRDADGATTVTPASPALRALIEADFAAEATGKSEGRPENRTALLCSGRTSS